MKRISVILLMLLLCGCEIKELENRDFVLQLLIDKKSEYSCQVGVAEFSSQEGDSLVRMNFFNGSGQTIANALEEINSNSSGQLYFGHTQLCIISVDALKNEETLKELIDLSERNQELNRRILLTATDTPTAFSQDNKGEIYALVKEYYSGNSNYKNRNIMLDLGRVTKQLLETDNCIIPILHKEEENISIERCAVINNYTYVGETTKQQSKSIMWLTEYEKPEDVINIRVNNIPAVIRLRQTGIERIAYKDKLVINIKAQGEVYEYILGKGLRNKDIENMTEEELKKQLYSCLSFLQKECKTDCIGIKELYRKNNYGVYLNNRDNIDEFVNNLPVEINVQVDFKEKSIS